ncbi:hypothetical protein [Neisseria iguanae]|nr:hypothetical protein [Neisseria iguanae]
MVTHQKILRREYARNGAVGLAALMAYQLPFAVLLGAALNVTKGKNPEENLVQNAIKTMTSLGYIGQGMSVALEGGFNSSSTALAPIKSSFQLGKQVLSEDADLYTVLRNTPLGR